MSNTELVELIRLEPTLVIDLRYATDDNFLGRAVYPNGRAFLRREAAEGVIRVHRALGEHGLRLKIWDAYRPLSVQRALWEILPDHNFVANPATGSHHNRGAAVDVTLVDADGRELEMPTPFDEFSDRAHPNYQELPLEVLENRKILQDAMAVEGFKSSRTEWWHFSAPNAADFDLLDIDLDQVEI